MLEDVTLCIMENSKAGLVLHVGTCTEQSDTFPVSAAHAFTGACLKCATPT